jgi:hypothetical protein
MGSISELKKKAQSENYMAFWSYSFSGSNALISSLAGRLPGQWLLEFLGLFEQEGGERLAHGFA